MDKEAATTMMEAIPAFDWSEVALKKDVETAISLAKSELEVVIAKSIKNQTLTFVGWMFACNSVLVAAFGAIVIFAK